MLLKRLFGPNPEENLPDGWQFELIDKVATRGSGHTPNKKKPEYWNGGIKWVSLADSNMLDNIYIIETDKEISELGIANSSAVKHSSGTVILLRDASVGRSAILGQEMAVSQHFIAWQCGKNLNNYFLYYLLQLMKPEFERMAVGSTIKTIGLGYFKKMKIPVPPLAEQKAIAQILGTWDEAIAVTEGLIEALTLRKRALMQRLLTGEVRFVGFDDAWEEVSLGTVTCESRVRNSDVDTTDFPVFGVNNEIGLNSDPKYYSEDLSRYKVVEPEMFAYNPMRLDVGSIGYSFHGMGRGVVSPDYVVFACDPQFLISKFLYHYTKSHRWYHWTQQAGAGSVRVRIYYKHLAHQKMLLPSINEQYRIAEVLDTSEEEIHALIQYKSALQEQKRGLMQVLLTGQVRVDVDE